ncbi:MAG: BlaI/MecI/CopY family transcriptional regulator [Planctomycetota bacterium]
MPVLSEANHTTTTFTKYPVIHHGMPSRPSFPPLGRYMKLGKKKSPSSKLTPATPTRGETELLSLLWEHGDRTLSEVHELMHRKVGYTTVQTRLNRMVEKGLAEREKVGRKPMVYRAAVQPDQVGAGALDSLVSQVTRGSVVPLVAHLVQSTELSDDEIDQLRNLIEQAQQRASDDSRAESKP